MTEPIEPAETAEPLDERALTQDDLLGEDIHRDDLSGAEKAEGAAEAGDGT